MNDHNEATTSLPQCEVSLGVADSAVDVAWAQRLAEGYRHELEVGWQSDERLRDHLKELPEPLASDRGFETIRIVVNLDGQLVRMSQHGTWLRVSIASHTHDPVALLATAMKLTEALPPAQPAESAIHVRFCYATGMGASSYQRAIEVPSWWEVSGNYPEVVRRPLSELMTGFRPSFGGRLILWHGPSGTGKTFALRALAHNWRPWCDLWYVSDPEAFFGSAEYIKDVVLPGDAETPEERWRLLAIEDTGELLSPDARVRTGQGLARLLNLTDGLLGQGLRVMILITTNEPLSALHPAVARPGRCACSIEFKTFTQDEARDWLSARGLSAEVRGRQSLAELFAASRGDVDRVARSSSALRR